MANRLRMAVVHAILTLKGPGWSQQQTAQVGVRPDENLCLSVSSSRPLTFRGKTGVLPGKYVFVRIDKRGRAGLHSRRLAGALT
jgi:hypothetical protein